VKIYGLAATTFTEKYRKTISLDPPNDWNLMMKHQLLKVMMFLMRLGPNVRACFTPDVGAVMSLHYKKNLSRWQL
jgi:hypothetical protein